MREVLSRVLTKRQGVVGWAKARPQMEADHEWSPVMRLQAAGSLVADNLCSKIHTKTSGQHYQAVHQ